MKILVSAGEPSGDQRGAEVLSKIFQLAGDEVTAFGMGGKHLEGAGMDILFNMSDYAVMGFAEIVGSLKRFLTLEKELTAVCVDRQPDCVLLVDYPGFNMRLGRRLKKLGFPVIHYVAPQMWAWGSWRVRKLRKSTDLLLTLFQFEEHFFNQRGVNAVFTGHPLKNRVEPNINPGEYLGLLPGSREQEVTQLLPPMLEAYRILKRKGAIKKGLLAVSDHLENHRDLYKQASATPGIELINGTDRVLEKSRAALVCSGTATLETALHLVPFAVCYRAGRVTYAIAQFLVRGIGRIGMANIVAGTDVAPEFIQGEVTPDNLANAVEPFLLSDEAHGAAKEKLKLVGSGLGSGDAAENAASELLRFIGALEGRGNAVKL